MARYGRGLICLTLTEERCRAAQPAARWCRTTARRSAPTSRVSIEAAEGVTTGISAADRARTVQAAIRPDASPRDIVQPGHIFPLMAQDGGVLVRAGHTEAGCDLARLAGLTPAAVICEILKDDGEMARLPDLVDFAAQHGLKIGTITDLIQYRSRTESLVHARRRARHRDRARARSGSSPTATASGARRISRSSKATSSPAREVLVRVHEPVSLIDLLDAGSTSHSWNFHDALAAIARADCGVILLLHREETARRAARAREAADARCAAAEDGAAQLRHRRADPART